MYASLNFNKNALITVKGTKKLLDFSNKYKVLFKMCQAIL